MEAANIALPNQIDIQQLLVQLSSQQLDPTQLDALEPLLQRYQVEGVLLIEGLDVTDRETIHTLTQLLISQESVLQQPKFSQVSQLMRFLFRAQSSLILSAEHEQAKLFMGLEDETRQVTTYAMQSLQASHFIQAARSNQVLNIPDLATDCPTECERSLLTSGVRALLLIPLTMKSTRWGSESGGLLGLVGLVSDRPYHFDSVDCQHATTLTPALTAALHQAIQQRFTNIHPSVEWRFAQEIERRSWGLPAEPILFTDVHPLYGISDIRGSSEARNQAIQADLLAQFQLGLAIVDAVCESQATSLVQQLRLDLLEKIEQLHHHLTVDAEITLMRYLSENLEVYFDYFAQCNLAAEAAVEAYRAACTNEHQCIYTARNHYDQVIHQINARLRKTWNHWQVTMQKMISHYCDVEATDGIDHMIYAGPSINPKFCQFHLHNLRYDQLRAVCDCARTAFNLKKSLNTPLDITHLVLVQNATVSIFHDESTERLFDVRGTKDTRYEIVKKRIDKALDSETKTRITQPGMLTLVYSTAEEWEEYERYCHYLIRDGWIADEIEFGYVEPLQGVTGLRFARTRILPAA
ncbi:MAG: GAF domain-containing protein [Cyanothece sp. SIO1E1]|nr:GAF domain-containing protein [Cyanothece sp. SIO1E1]